MDELGLPCVLPISYHFQQSTPAFNNAWMEHADCGQRVPRKIIARNDERKRGCEHFRCYAAQCREFVGSQFIDEFSSDRHIVGCVQWNEHLTEVHPEYSVRGMRIGMDVPLCHIIGSLFGIAASKIAGNFNGATHDHHFFYAFRRIGNFIQRHYQICEWTQSKNGHWALLFSETPFQEWNRAARMGKVGIQLRHADAWKAVCSIAPLCWECLRSP